MREFLEVLKYTFKENVKKKSFIISTIVVLVLVVGVMLIPAIVTKVQSSDDNNDNNQTDKSIVYLVDKSGYFEKNLEDIQKQLPEYQIKKESESKIESLKSDIKENGKNFLIIAHLVNDAPSFEYYTKQYDDGPSAEIINKVFKNIYTTSILKQANISEQAISNVLNDLNISINELGQNKWIGYILSCVISALLFFAVYFYGYGVSNSVASEKTSRVMELLVTSVKPSRIILGKTAGMGLLGLMQFAIIIIAGVTTYMLSFPDDFTLEGIKIDLSSFTPFSIAMLIIYFILGYTLFALMYAVVGATVSKAEDVNSAMMPMSFVSIISFYLPYSTFMNPESTLASVVSLIPFTAPFSVPSRLISTNVQAWEIAVSLLLLVVTIALVGMLSIKLYSFAVLHYGDRMKLGKLFKISKENKVQNLKSNM